MKERTEKMAELRDQGMTLEEIGSEFGLTAERVRQILSDHEDYDKWLEKSRKKFGDRQREYTDEEIKQEIHDLAHELDRIPSTDDLDKHLDVGKSVIASRFGSFVNAVDEAGVLTKEFVEPNVGNYRLDEAVQDLKEVNELVDGSLSCDRYENQREEKHMSNTTIRTVFETWTDALIWAGIKPVSLPMHDNPQKRTKDECLSVLIRVMQMHGPNIATHLYEKEKRDKDPCVATIMNRFSSWSNAKDKAKELL